MNKLDYLAQKEEELRKLNEQIDTKNKQNLENIALADSLDMRKTGGQNPFLKASIEENKQEEVFRSSTTSLLK